MTPTAEPIPTDVPLVAIAVGNTRARVGLFRGETLASSSSILPGTPEAEEAIRALAEREPGGVGAIVVASVADERAKVVEGVARRVWSGAEVFRVKRDLPIPMRHAMRDASTVGVDRFLNAIAAYRKAEQACAVVDVGTAVTVDFVDGEGTFHGGAIAPGLNMMLRALHAGTAQLPEITYTPPEVAPDGHASPFGGDTPEAMRFGVAAAVRGLVRDLVERYAEFYGAFPQVIATGGDMGVLEGDGLIEHFVPDLQLLGIRAVAAAAAAGTDADEA